ncbi:hypothetical protein GIB67_012584 [Kingdonia uniflora]|uniref:Protein kinase domain-containing protein n=1 Tax=Kingdonia uniflora TaxID=39325 RepID=A0A7J7NEV1_9MAGN|nr:hypothetical protein GIB67_012584 [Kingdonia uniflora]
MGFLSSLCGCLEKKKRERDEGGEGEEVWDLFFEFQTLQVATNGFSEVNLLGHGGFGPVYKGLLPSGQEIAVKKLSLDSRQGLREFTNEVKLLLKVQHKNLVTLLGCCVEGTEKMLVYEYLPNKSLDNFIFDKNKSTLLDWSKRHVIITGLARVETKISDFGLARLFPGEDTHLNTFKILWYMALSSYARILICEERRI